MACNFAAGTYTGTGAAQNLQIGFIPAYMEIYNITDGDEVHAWFDGMTADTGVLTTTAVASNPAGGFTRYTGSLGANAEGVSVGTDISENAKVYRYACWGYS